MSQFESLPKYDAFKNGVLWKEFLFSRWPSILKSMIKKINVLESNLFTTSFYLSVIFNRKTVYCMVENKTVSFGEEYERSKMITSGKIEQSVECCFSILLKPFQRVKHLNSSISLLYTFGEFLAKSLKITHLNLLLISMDVVSRTSFMILLHHSLNYSV